MNTAFDKQMRRSERIASLITLFAIVIFQIILSMLRGQYVFSFGVSVIEDISVVLIPLMFLFTKFRNNPWDKIVGVLYAVMLIPHIESLPGIVRSLTYFNIIDYSWYALTSVASFAYRFVFIIGAVVCVLMYFNVVKFKKRKGLLILMYFLVVCGVLKFLYDKRSICSMLVLIWGICFHNENAETGSKKGKAARVSVLFFIPLVFAFVFVGFCFVASNYTAYLTDEGAEGVGGNILLVIGALILICMLMFPLWLFDKKFENDKTNGTKLQNVQ